jgi:hypothetical protein
MIFVAFYIVTAAFACSFGLVIYFMVQECKKSNTRNVGTETSFIDEKIKIIEM